MNPQSLPVRNLRSLGCNAKMRAADLLHVIGSQGDFAKLAPDCGKFPFGEGAFFTIDTVFPITTSATLFGRLAVLHSLNDLFAKGANATDVCLSYGIDLANASNNTCQSIMAGAESALRELSVRISKAHTYISDSISLTVAAIGVRKRPERLMSNGNTYALILTKPLGASLGSYLGSVAGSGDLSTSSEMVLSLSHGLLVDNVRDHCFAGTTDISGFGLIGHLVSLSASERCTISVASSSVPLVSGLLEASGLDSTTNCSAERNKEDFEDGCRWGAACIGVRKTLLCNGETSGPLACIVNAEFGKEFLSLLHSKGFEHACLIGELIKNGSSQVIIS